MTWNYTKETKTISVAEVLELYPQLGVPHFQRGLVWGNDSVGSLLESLFYGTPCGSFVFWDSGANQEYGVPMPSGTAKGIRYLVVDGQQRIRSLRQIFQNEGASDVDEPDTTGAAEDERENAKAWCINLTQLKAFKDILEPHNREYALFVYTTRPEKADVKSPLRKNIIPIDDLLAERVPVDPTKHIRPRQNRPASDFAPLLADLKSRMRGIRNQMFFVTVTTESPAEVINLYNRINSGGKRVEAEERAFARLVALYPQSSHHVAEIFDAIHPKTASPEAPADERLRRDDVLERQKENRFGFKLFIRTLVQVCNYHLDRSTGSQYLSFNVIHSDTFAGLVSTHDTNDMEFLWGETQEVLVTVRDVLKQELHCDDLAFLPDTMSLVPIFHMLIQFPRLREPRYRPILGWATLALLLANHDTDDLLGFVAGLRKDGDVASAVLPGLLKKLDAAASHAMRAPQTLEYASSIQNRYVLLLYGMLRRNGVRDFSYSNLTDTSPLLGKEARPICEAWEPQKQHIAPFSCLVDALGDKDAKRGASHRFNNIGNLTYISAKLNHYDGGLGSKPIDRSLEPAHNLAAHFLSDDEQFGKVGHLYDELKQVLCDEKGSPKETINRRFEAFCKARRHVIAHGFLSWLDDLSRASEEVLSSADVSNVALRLKAIAPKCVAPKSLPLTQQIRAMDYPKDIEDVLVGYIRHIQENCNQKKRSKIRENEIELRLSDGGAVRLLLSPSEIRIVYKDWITNSLRTQTYSTLGLPSDQCLFHRKRGGTLTSEMLDKVSACSEKLDALRRELRVPAHRRKVTCDPAFAAVIEAYDKVAEQHLRCRGNGRTYRQICPSHWPDAVHYEFLNDREEILIGLHLESEDARSLGPLLSPLAQRELAPGVIVKWDPLNSRKRGALMAKAQKDRGPEIAVQAMKALITLTRDVVEKSLKC